MQTKTKVHFNFRDLLCLWRCLGTFELNIKRPGFMFFFSEVVWMVVQSWANSFWSYFCSCHWLTNENADHKSPPAFTSWTKMETLKVAANTSWSENLHRMLEPVWCIEHWDAFRFIEMNCIENILSQTPPGQNFNHCSALWEWLNFHPQYEF